MTATPWRGLQDRTARDGASPLVTMYDDATGERVELSATSFGNWVAKSANLLVDELDVVPGDRVALELPAHWQSLVLAVAVGAVGAELAPDGLRVVTEDVAAPDALVLSLRPMGAGRAAPGPGLDYAAEVRLHGDYFDGGDGTGALEELPQLPTGARVLLSGDAFDAAWRTFLAVLDCGGSLVLVRHEDPATRERRVASERVTRVL